MGFRHTYERHLNRTVMITIYTLQKAQTKYFISQLTQLSPQIALCEGTQHYIRRLLFQSALIRGPIVLFQICIRFLLIIFMEATPLCISLNKLHLLSPTQNRFNCCTLHYGIYILFTHQQMQFLLKLEKFNKKCICWWVNNMYNTLFILFQFILLPLHAGYMFRPVFRPYIQGSWKYFPSAYRQASRLTNTLFALRSLMS
jgi:hypothetical protein